MEALELTHDVHRELLIFRGGGVQLLDQFQHLLYLGALLALGLLRPLGLVLLHGDQFLRRIGNTNQRPAAHRPDQTPSPVDASVASRGWLPAGLLSLSIDLGVSGLVHCTADLAGHSVAEWAYEMVPQL